MTFSQHFHKLPLQCVVRASATETNFETFILVSDFESYFSWTISFDQIFAKIEVICTYMSKLKLNSKTNQYKGKRSTLTRIIFYFETF